MLVSISLGKSSSSVAMIVIMELVGGVDWSDPGLRRRRFVVRQLNSMVDILNSSKADPEVAKTCMGLCCVHHRRQFLNSRGFEVRFQPRGAGLQEPLNFPAEPAVPL